MTITREQVADLQPGDVVELHMSGWQEGVTLRGPLHESSPGTLWLADVQIRHHDGGVHGWSMQTASTLTVVSRAPRPLYVNHPRTGPVPRDVVLAPDGNGETQVWICITALSGAYRPKFVKPERSGLSYVLPNGDPESRMCQPFRLLVDGETGQVVP